METCFILSACYRRYYSNDTGFLVVLSTVSCFFDLTSYLLFHSTGATWIFKFNTVSSRYTQLGGKLVGTGYVGGTIYQGKR